MAEVKEGKLICECKENVRKRKIEDHIFEKEAISKIKRVELEDKRLWFCEGK